MGALAPIVPREYYGVERVIDDSLYATQAGSDDAFAGLIQKNVDYTLDHLAYVADAAGTGTGGTLYVIKLPHTLDISAAVAAPTSTGTLLATLTIANLATNARTAISLDALTAAQRKVAYTDRIIVVVVTSSGAWTLTGFTLMVLGRTGL
jgi:hypothetical protein